MANKLTKESSLYLKQHQNNPVFWYPWGEEALEVAQQTQKLLIVSIGYSSCHWCHVMERESFENKEVALLMNEHFVSIKVDREERPDIDQIYMTAVQLMTQAGGWPLNCICLPDGRPIYGGTYFNPENWKNILLQIQDMWENTPEIAYDYAQKLTSAIKQSERLPIVQTPEIFLKKDLSPIIKNWIELFDKVDGGYNRAPKFPLPNNWVFLLRYGELTNDKSILNQVHLTLQKIAYGGIFDQVNGGFSRYSVDHLWHIPHFEKMLYDNAQLMSLYCEAYQQQNLTLYKDTVNHIFNWLITEMQDDNGGFYSAIDADSEGIEGGYYVFSYGEIDEIFNKKDADFVKELYHVTSFGNWTAENTNIFYRDLDTDTKLMKRYNLGEEEFSEKIKKTNHKLRQFRKQNKVYPAVDKKKITAWNALMTKGLLKAYNVFGDQSYYKAAIKNIQFIKEHLITNDNSVLHQKTDNNRTIFGFLDDYACTIDAFITLYEVTFEEKWLQQARILCEKAIQLFYIQERQEFVYSIDDSLIAQKVDVMDNVIPSSSSMIVRQIHKLSILFENNEYGQLVDKIIGNVLPHMPSYAPAYSNWGITLLEKVYGCNEIALTGNKALDFRKEFSAYYIPNKVFMGGTHSSLPLLEDKDITQSKVYICKNKTCSLPQDSVENAIRLISTNGN